MVKFFICKPAKKFSQRAGPPRWYSGYTFFHIGTNASSERTIVTGPTDISRQKFDSKRTFSFGQKIEKISPGARFWKISSGCIFFRLRSHNGTIIATVASRKVSAFCPSLTNSLLFLTLFLYLSLLLPPVYSQLCRPS